MRLPDSISTITPSGAIEPIATPTYLLPLEEAIVLRDYVWWMAFRNLRNSIWCRDCWAAQDEPTMIDQTEPDVSDPQQAIGIHCTHRLLIHFGRLPPITRTYEQSDILWKPPQGISLTDEVPVIRMSDAEARILRDYKKILNTYFLVEALFCNTCFDRDYHDGCRATVVDRAIDVLCRHRQLQHRGGYATTQ